MAKIAGVEILKAMHYDTQTGGEIVIGQCATDDNHMIVFAHIDLEEVDQLAQVLHDCYLKYRGTEEEA